MHRSKVNEVEKLSATIRDLEEAVLAGGAAVNAARDFQRQVHELMVRRTCRLYILVSYRIQRCYLRISNFVIN